MPVFRDMPDETGTDATYFAALSAYESGWLGQQAQDLHNPFGLTNGGGNERERERERGRGRGREGERGSGTAGPEFADEVADAIDEGIVGGGAGLRGVRRRGRSWRRRGRRRGYGNTFHAALDNELGPNANTR